MQNNLPTYIVELHGSVVKCAKTDFNYFMPFCPKN